MTPPATTYTQANRPLAVATPLGSDVLLLEKFSAVEALSEPFLFRLDLLAQSNTSIAFEKLLGQKVAIRLDLPDNKKRFFNGVVSRFTQGRDLPASQGDAAFTRYRMELVPPFAMLRHKTNCRTFQQITVVDILKQVLTGLDVSYQVQGTFQQRDYCVQYRETDFAFASRLMEEEGIFYFFKHSETGCQMVLANAAQAHPAVEASPTVTFESLVHRTSRTEDRVLGWEKSQQVQAGKTVLHDSCFELPGDNLESTRPVPPDVTVGKVQHKLTAGGNSAYEQYDYPGGYAQRFDGVDPTGGARAGDLSKVAPDGNRTVGIRMAQETLPAVVINGESDCRHFTSGHQFNLKGHPNADGAYVLTRLEHNANIEGTYTTNNPPTLAYDNSFECIPLGLPFQPPRTTPKPSVAGTQPAVVVGPAGEEIFTDKYGRIKVQFDWDRLGKKNAESSCWVRVATPWAGKQWGTVHIPRIGMEVMVAFEEGDPDRPIVIGAVYNAAQMPPYTLPANKTQSGVKSRSSLKGTDENFNEICFEDKKGEELLYIRAEKDQKIAVENDEAHWVGHDRTKEVDHDEVVHIGHDRTETVDNDETITIKHDRKETVEHDETITIKHDRTETVENNETITITNDRTETVKQGNEKVTIAQGNRTVEVSTGNESLTVGQGNRTVEISMGNETLTIKMGNQTTKLDLGASSTEAMQSIELKVGQSSVKVDQMGVTIKGMMITIEGQIQTQVKGMMTTITGSAILQETGGIILIG